MPLIPTRFKPLVFLGNRHLQTILPALLFLSQKPKFTRERLELPDGDFLDLDWILTNQSKPLFILCHGLEGNSNANYISRSAKYLKSEGYNVLAWNYRGCSGEMNRKRRFYHSGETADLGSVITYCQNKNFCDIVIMGFSLGGNIVLKYIAEQSHKTIKPVKAVISVSPPIDLDACAKNLELKSNGIYLKRFLVSLKDKIRNKNIGFPDLLENNSLEGLNNFFEFDDAFTAPMHGFANAKEYYALASSKPLLAEINIPTLLIQPKNDPFLPTECYPINIAEKNENLYLEIPNSGGHLGFLSNPFKTYYPIVRAVEFIKKLN